MFFQGAFFLKFWPYVWLVFKSGLWWRAYNRWNEKVFLVAVFEFLYVITTLTFSDKNKVKGLFIYINSELKKTEFTVVFLTITYDIFVETLLQLQQQICKEIYKILKETYWGLAYLHTFKTNRLEKFWRKIQPFFS